MLSAFLHIETSKTKTFKSFMLVRADSIDTYSHAGRRKGNECGAGAAAAGGCHASAERHGATLQGPPAPPRAAVPPVPPRLTHSAAPAGFLFYCTNLQFRYNL